MNGGACFVGTLGAHGCSRGATAAAGAIFDLVFLEYKHLGSAILIPTSSLLDFVAAISLPGELSDSAN